MVIDSTLFTRWIREEVSEKARLIEENVPLTDRHDALLVAILTASVTPFDSWARDHGPLRSASGVPPTRRRSEPRNAFKEVGL